MANIETRKTARGPLDITMRALQRAPYQALRAAAWRRGTAETPAKHPEPGTIVPGWGFEQRAPAWWDPRGAYLIMSHVPILLARIATRGLVSFPASLVSAWILEDGPRPWGRDIHDNEVFRIVTETSLLLFGDIDGDTYTFEMPPEAPPFPEPRQGNYERWDPQTLRIEFDLNTFKIRDARTAKGQLGDHLGGAVSRNELLVGMLVEIEATWLHVMTHVAAERSAAEIAMKRVEDLEPSAHFAQALHTGLLHEQLAPVSTWRWWNPLHYNARVIIPDITERLHQYPFPSHSRLSNDKRRFAYYRFIMAARSAVHELVRKQKLGVDAEDLFHNCVMHSAEHAALYECLRGLPPWSADGTGTFRSYWGSFCFVFIWLQHLHNPINSEYVRDFEHLPFYAALMDRLRLVDEERANQLVVSCSS